LAVFFLSACGNGNADNPGEEEKSETDAIDEAMVIDINQFSFELFRQTDQTEPDKNIFISPMSISLALGMTFNGAEGETEAAMRRALKYGQLNKIEINEFYKTLIDDLNTLDTSVIMKIANSIWLRENYQIKPEFLELNRKYFDSRVEAINLDAQESIDMINNWVSEKTNGKITKIISYPVHPNVMMYLINAIYFKGTWTYEFDPERTSPMPFHVTAEKDTTVDMMYQKENFGIIENEDFQAVQLPYGDENFAMTAILPAEEKTPNDIINTLTSEKWNSWAEDFHTEEIRLYLPKFKMSYGKTMNEPLSSMGMGVAFEKDANFKGMEPEGELFISRVLHKTFVQVDEEGTEAAAVTAVEMMTKAMPQSKEIRFNRPFVFVIHEKTTGAIIFMGKIMQPVWEN
jgi:serpin B